jgi:hypothetical protein
VIALITVAYYAFKVNAVLAFWLAYIMTRPLGASIGDFMSQKSHKYGGLGLGTTDTSYIFLGCILVLVAYLSVTKKDQTPPELIAEEEERRRAHEHGHPHEHPHGHPHHGLEPSRQEA